MGQSNKGTKQINLSSISLCLFVPLCICPNLSLCLCAFATLCLNLGAETKLISSPKGEGLSPIARDR